MRFKPTAEQIAAMEARGWRYDVTFGSFHAGRGADLGRGVLRMQVRSMDPVGWRTSYGVPGQDFSAYELYSDPMAAADVAEAWLREEIARFGFPWLAGLQGAVAS